MGLVDTINKAAMYDANSTAEAVKNARVEGANTAMAYEELGRYRDYVDSITPALPAEGLFRQGVQVGPTVIGGKTFVPAEQAAYKNHLAEQAALAEAEKRGLAMQPPETVSALWVRPANYPTNYDGRSGFGKALEVLNTPNDPIDVRY